MSDKIIHDMMEDIIDDLVEQGNTGSYPYILDKEDFGGIPSRKRWEREYRRQG